jgi:hypothetical protein
VLAILVIVVFFYFFTLWQTIVLIVIAGLILTVLYSTGHWKPVRTFKVNMTAKDLKKDGRLRWAVIPAKQVFKKDLVSYSSFAEYHDTYKYKVDRNRVSMRLIESTIESAGKPLLYKVRDGIVGTSWIADWYGRTEVLGVGEVEDLKDEVEWHDASLGVRYFILKHTPGYSEFLCSERERLKRGVSYSKAELNHRGVRQDADGVYIGPDGPEDELVRFLLSDDHLSKYGITHDEFYASDSLVKILNLHLF